MDLNFKQFHDIGRQHKMLPIQEESMGTSLQEAQLRMSDQLVEYLSMESLQLQPRLIAIQLCGEL